MRTSIELVIGDETFDTSVIVDTDAQIDIVSKTPQSAIVLTDRVVSSRGKICKMRLGSTRVKGEERCEYLGNVDGCGGSD